MAKQINPLARIHAFPHARSTSQVSGFIPHPSNRPAFTGETNGGSVARREQRSDELPACRHPWRASWVPLSGNPDQVKSGKRSRVALVENPKPVFKF